MSSELSHGFGVRWMDGWGLGTGVNGGITRDLQSDSICTNVCRGYGVCGVGATKRGSTRELSNLSARPISHVLMYKLSTRKADD